MLHIETMAPREHWDWRNDPRRIIFAHLTGFFGANLVWGTLTLLLLHAAGRALGWTLSPSLGISALAVGIACLLAGAALLTPRRGQETPAMRRRLPSRLL